jgi:hypothetical protein
MPDYGFGVLQGKTPPVRLAPDSFGDSAIHGAASFFTIKTILTPVIPKR